MDQLNISPKSTTDDLQHQVLSRGLDFLDRMAAVRHTMPLQYMRTFMIVYLNPGLSVDELAKKAHVAQSVMSRHLRDIGPQNRHLEPGFGLIDISFHPTDMRKHIYVLTPKGKLLAQQLFKDLAAPEERNLIR
jgi:DNA-binding MarR family transcriptional regulator